MLWGVVAVYRPWGDTAGRHVHKSPLTNGVVDKQFMALYSQLDIILSAEKCPLDAKKSRLFD
jgi:hypothetical protein